MSKVNVDVFDTRIQLRKLGTQILDYEMTTHVRIELWKSGIGEAVHFIWIITGGFSVAPL